MKKILILLMVGLFILVGCGKPNKNSVAMNFTKKIDKTKSYRLTGNLEIVNNDEIYKYKVDVSYKKGDFYRVNLTNTNNNHTQVILKNKDSVYVLTPSLNKSFKFQSDWPYNNSQIYLLKAISNDINNDENKKFKIKNNKYVFTTKVNYPNNKNLVSQKIHLSKKINVQKIEVYNKNGSTVMTMNFDNIDYSPTFKRDYFELNSIMKKYNTTNKKVKKTANLDDSIYPLFLPKGTKLAKEEKVQKDNGERIIMTFEGKKPFLLVEEVAKQEDNFTIIPTQGEPYRLMDTLGVMTNNSLSWSSNGIEYYLVSNVLKQHELVEVAQSINLVQTMK